MGLKLGIALRAARKRKKLTLQQVADRIGVSYPAVQQWEAGRTTPSRDNAPKVAEAYGMHLEDLNNLFEKEESLSKLLFPATDEQNKATGEREAQIAAHYERLSEENSDSYYVSKEDFVTNYGFNNPVPVYGSVVGGSDIDFYIGSDIVEYTGRPPGARQIKRLYALHILGESMSPKFEPGDMIYVNPDRSPAVGEYAVIELVNGDAEFGRGGIVKRLVRRTPTKLIVEQFNPAREFEVDIDSVRAVHRVVPWRELLGK